MPLVTRSGPTTFTASRRKLLVALGAGAASALLAACGSQRPTMPTQAPVAAPGDSGGAPAPTVAATVPGKAPVLQPTRPAAAAQTGSPPPTARAAATIVVPPTAVPPTPLPPTATVEPTATPVPYIAERLTERLGAAQTSYAGGTSERNWNVELATERLNGTTIAPGAIFSFNEAVGPTTLKAGFRIGYGILFREDRPETVPSVAGGICQVATTVYQAAFWAGLPFVERHYHLYWIPRYGQPPSGRTGLDATVDDPGVDLKFKNTTRDWLRLDSWHDGGNVGFTLRGAETGWEVEASQPRMFDVVKADREIARQEDPTMDAGRELQVESAHDGFRLTMSRLVKFQDKVIDELLFTNYYRPSRNVVLVGTKGATPTPSVSPTVEVAEPRPPPPTPTPVPGARLPDGQVRVPGVVGLPEAEARRIVDSLGLNNTYSNYQGPGEVPAEALRSVEIGSVLSQNPTPGSIVGSGTTVYLAVRKA